MAWRKNNRWSWGPVSDETLGNDPRDEMFRAAEKILAEPEQVCVVGACAQKRVSGREFCEEHGRQYDAEQSQRRAALLSQLTSSSLLSVDNARKLMEFADAVDQARKSEPNVSEIRKREEVALRAEALVAKRGYLPGEGVTREGNYIPYNQLAYLVRNSVLRIEQAQRILDFIEEDSQKKSAAQVRKDLLALNEQRIRGMQDFFYPAPEPDAKTETKPKPAEPEPELMPLNTKRKITLE